MGNLARNSSVETAYGLTLSAQATRTTDAANTGDYSVLLVGHASIFGGPSRSDTCEWEITKVVPGTSVTLSLAVNESTGSTQDLQLLVDDGDGVLSSFATRTSGQGTRGRWYIWTPPGNFVALGETLRVVVRAQAQTISTWYVDDLVVDGTAVAVKLAERSIDAVVSLLQSNLSTELAAIDTDRGDGITMAVPANSDYYKREKKEIAGATVHVEVFEEDWRFDNPYSDANAQRATYDLPVVVRVTCFNRGGDSADTMHKRKRRYATGVFNVINKNATLGGTDAALLDAVVTDVESEIERDAEDSIAKVRVTLRLLVKCEEVQ